MPQINEISWFNLSFSILAISLALTLKFWSTSVLSLKGSALSGNFYKITEFSFFN